MSDLHGTEEIKKALGVLIDLGMGVEDALEDDGKVKFMELVGIISGEALDIVSVIKNAGELKAELKDWDEEEREEVLEWAVERFDLDNDVAEKVIEKCLTIIKELGDVIFLVKGSGE